MYKDQYRWARFNRRSRLEGKRLFMKFDMPDNIDTIGYRVKTMISMMGYAITKEDIRKITKFHLVFVVRPKFWEAFASKDTKKGMVGFTMEHMFKRRDFGVSMGRHSIDEIDNDVEGKVPKMMRNTRLS